MRYKRRVARILELPIVAGGRLLTQPSIGLESVPAQDFVRLLNVFRDTDHMARMPGWVKFRPNTGIGVTNQYAFDASETVLATAELVRGDGTRAFVGASQSKIKYYDYATGAWIQIGSGFSGAGVPWQIVVQSGYVIFNNAVNLPVWWQIGDAAVTPLHELREAGVASVGRISTYNGFLFVGDIVEVRADQLTPWMNGYGNFGTSGAASKSASFNLLTAEARYTYTVTGGSGNIVATLPTVTLTNYGLYFWVVLGDAAMSVTFSPQIGGETVTITGLNDKAFVYWDGQRWAAQVFSGGALPTHDPYGIVPAALCEYIADEVAWGELGQPINWAPLVSLVKPSASSTLYLPFKPYNWVAKETRVAVVNGGPDAGTLGGQSAYPEGVQIVTIGAFSDVNFGVPITIEVTTDTALSYPRTMDVTRWGDVSTFVGKQRMGNGEKITAMTELNGVLIIYQVGGIFINRWTAQAAAPFALRSKYRGSAVPLFGDCVAAIRNSYHLYPAVEGSFIMFDGLTDPVVHEMCEGARDLFFSGLQPTDRCFAVDNPTLQMIWFVNASRTMCFRYRQDTAGVSEMDVVPTAASFIRRPNSSEDWFTLAIGRFVFQWGRVGNTVQTWLRDGSAPAIPARLTSGLNAFRTQMVEKTLHSFTPILSSPSPDTALEVSLRGTHNPSAALTELLVPVEELPSPAGDNFVACFFQQNYFQDSIDLVDTRDIDFKLSARLFEFEVLRGSSPVTRSVVA